MIENALPDSGCSCAECRARNPLLRRRRRKGLLKSDSKAVPLPLRGQSTHPQQGQLVWKNCHSPMKRPGGSDALNRKGLASLFPGCYALNVYPVDKTESVTNAMQYYFEVFAPSVHPHVDIPEGWKVKQFFDETFQFTMADPMWFSATVAFSELMKQRTICGTAEKTDEVLRHQSRAVNELRRRLLDEKAPFDDIVVLTITTLMSLDIAARDITPWSYHIQGIERILAARGGLDSLHSHDYVKHKVIGFQTFWLYKQMCLGAPIRDGSYPKHPFPPEICTAISRFPRELGDMALDGYLNVSLIQLMADIFAIYARFVPGQPKPREDVRRLKCLAYEVEELFKILTLSWIEQLMIGALIDYCVSVDTDRRLHWLLGGALQIDLSRALCMGVKYEEIHHDILVWLGALLVACSEPMALSVKLGHRVLGACSQKRPLYRSCVLETCRMFIWDDEILTPKLDEKFKFSVSPSESPASLSQPSTPAQTDQENPLDDQNLFLLHDDGSYGEVLEIGGEEPLPKWNSISSIPPSLSAAAAVQMITSTS